MQIEIRKASPQDAPELTRIYAPLVRGSAVSFELEPPSEEAFAQRIELCLANWACLVAELNGTVVGYAYGGQHRSREAYAWSVETSIYIDEQHRGQGVGGRLYPALIARLEDRGYRNAYAGIALPNEPSLALHRSVGFKDIGVFPRVGFKAGIWHDVAWLHRPLGGGDFESAPSPVPR